MKSPKMWINLYQTNPLEHFNFIMFFKKHDVEQKVDFDTFKKGEQRSWCICNMVKFLNSYGYILKLTVIFGDVITACLK